MLYRLPKQHVTSLAMCAINVDQRMAYEQNVSVSSPSDWHRTSYASTHSITLNRKFSAFSLKTC